MTERGRTPDRVTTEWGLTPYPGTGRTVSAVQTVSRVVALETIASESGVVLVDVTADWCAPCKAIKPVLHQLNADTAGLTVIAVDADADPEFAATFAVMSFPTLLFFVDGQLAHRLVGARGLAALREEVARVAAIPSAS